jgi:8-oxo-dGTP diphosphatase
MVKVEREISSGGVVIKNSIAGIKVLLIKDPYEKWTWPKGKLNKGETSLDAAIREIREETGLVNIKEVSKVGSTNYFYKRDGKLIYKTVYVYLFKSTGEENLVIQKAEIEDGEWVSKEEALSRVGYKGAKSIIKRAIADFKRRDIVSIEQ